MRGSHFFKIEFKSVIEAIDVSSTKKHFQHFSRLPSLLGWSISA
jgi:hypothetical protein